MGVTPVPQSKRVSVTSGGACADADRLIKALAQAPIASKDRVRFMVPSQKWQQVLYQHPGSAPSLLGLTAGALPPSPRGTDHRKRPVSQAKDIQHGCVALLLEF